MSKNSGKPQHSLTNNKNNDIYGRLKSHPSFGRSQRIIKEGTK